MAAAAEFAQRARLLPLLAVLLALPACSGDASSPDPLETAAVGGVGCHPGSPIAPARAVPGIETRLTPHGINGWALLYEQPPWEAGDEVKVVWRISGSGEVALVARGPGRLELAPSFGPEIHTGSNYDRPGDEWGSGFSLSSPGCWELEATRSEGSASIWLQVRQADD